MAKTVICYIVDGKNVYSIAQAVKKTGLSEASIRQFRARDNKIGAIRKFDNKNILTFTEVEVDEMASRKGKVGNPGNGGEV